MKTVVLAAAVFLFAKCAAKFGFRSTLQWACLLVVSVFPLSLAGGLIARPLEFLWNNAGAGERVTVAGAALAAFVAAIKRFGWGGTLSYGFQIAVFLAAVLLVGLGAFLAVVFIGEMAGAGR